MSSLPFVLGTPATGRRVFVTHATKGGSVAKEEKSFVDWLLGKITKEDQFFETDPILQKDFEGKSSGGTTSGKKSTVSIPSKKKNNGNGGGLGGLFLKKE